MLTVRRMTQIMMAGIAFAASLAVPGVAQAPDTPDIAALSSLQPGQWLLKPRGANMAERSLCLGDTRQLLQLRHSTASCRKFVISNGPRLATVHYTCAGGGHGQTTVRVETPRLVQISSQGIADKEPFVFEAEGRRVGACAAGGGGKSGRR
jgi:hypothetical protein